MLLKSNILKAALCAALCAATVTEMSAKLEGDGYYRVQNAKSERYIYVLDNTGKLNFEATTADLGALELWKGYDRTVSDPATVIYVKDVTGSNRDFDFMAQGTGVMEMIDHSVSVKLVSGTEDTYHIFGRDSGIARYIGDGTVDDADKGRVSSTQPANSEWVRWRMHPITCNDDQYFGITPDVEADGAYYASFYAAFPFSTASEGMEAFYVSKIDGNKAVISKIKGTVAAGTPVIIKTDSAQPSQNKLNLGGEATAPADNLLGGVYFKNESLSHNNVTSYDSRTMRLLGTTSDGKPGFVTSIDTYLPRNKAYLNVPEGTPAELRILTEEEYDAYLASVGSIEAGAEVRMYVDGLTLHVEGLTDGMEVRVCDITGRTVYVGRNSSIALPVPGMYIARVGNHVGKFVAQ